MRFGKNRSYAEAAFKVRQIGEYCIRKRLAALENKQEVPNDILTLILQTVRELPYKYYFIYYVLAYCQKIFIYLYLFAHNDKTVWES